MLVLSAPAFAVHTHFAGFGTASVSCFSSETADYVVNIQPEGPGRTRPCDAALDSLLGLQWEAGLAEGLDFGLQAVADRHEDRNVEAHVHVAQLRWHPNPTLSLRLGRMPTPAFLYSEDRQVRYAQPWVRPPVEVYGLVPAVSNDGIEFIQQGRWGDWHTEWQGGISAIDFESLNTNSDETYTIKTSQAYLALSLRQGNTLLKVGYSYARISFDNPLLDPLLSALRDPLVAFVEPRAAALADDLDVDDAPMHMVAVSGRKESGDWLLLGEIAHRTGTGPFRAQTGAYVTVGRRVGPWTPYATVARRWTSGKDSDSRANFDPLIQATVENLLATSRYDSTSVALGLSRELGAQATLKLQADWLQPDKNSWGLYYNHASDYDYANPPSELLYTLSVDFIF